MQEQPSSRGDAAGRPPLARSEARVILRIALPLVAAYLAEIAMFLTTKVVVGRLGYQELAAVGLASDLSFEVLVISMGLLSVVGVLVAQAEGAGQGRDAGQAVRQGFLVATAVGAVGTLLVWHLDSLLVLTGQDPEVVTLAQPYLRALSGFVLPSLWFAVLRSFVAALSRTGVVMVIAVAAVGLNYLLTLGLVEGAFGLPVLGIAGAGLATSLVAWAMFVALVVYVYRTAALRGYGLFQGRLRVSTALCAEIVRLGLPVAGVVALESGLFAALSILSGLLGAVSLAAYSVLMGWVSVPFVIALGLAEATMVRVAFGIGSGSGAAARQAGLIGMALAAALLGALLVLPLGLPGLIVAAFLDPQDPGYGEVSALCITLLMIAALFQLFDGLQAVASRALRGLRDTVVPLWLAGFGYWVLGIGGGSLMAFPLGLGAEGLWWGLALGLFATGSLLTWRFLRLTRNAVGRHQWARSHSDRGQCSF